jgi:hypothetical protein
MFDFLLDRDATDVSEAIDLVVRLIADRKRFDRSSLARRDREGSSEDRQFLLALQIVGEIEAKDGALNTLPESKAREYVQKLSSVLSRTIEHTVRTRNLRTSESVRDQSTRDLLKDVRQTRVHSVGTLLPDEPLSRVGTAALLGYLIALAIVSVYGIVALWPGATIFEARYLGCDARALLLTISGGVLGGVLDATRSLVNFAGNRLLAASWVWWYLLQPITGAIVAAVCYIVIRGGLVTSAEALNEPGLVVLAALVGMVSTPVVNKLNEVFVTLFTKTDSGDRLRP